MNHQSRITSILEAPTLDASITGFPSFYLSELDLPTEVDIPLPSHLRLGHLAERVVSILIQSSTNYEVLYEGVQFIEDEQTIGEIDFILANQNTGQLIHVELAYKFYLYDPHISSETVNNWIGPNRNDSLREKLDKLKGKQFPLLYHRAAKSTLDRLAIRDISQKLCFLASLFVPYQSDIQFPAAYQKTITGYYMDLETFVRLDHSGKAYYLPEKREWGMEPAEHDKWKSFGQVIPHIGSSIAENQALLCWQKQQASYSAFFIVWW